LRQISFILVLSGVLHCGGLAQDLTPPLEWGRLSVTAGYDFQKGWGQYFAGQERYKLDSMARNPISQEIPLGLKYGYFPGLEFFFQWPAEFRNKDNGDAAGMARIRWGVKSAFPQLLGLGLTLAFSYPKITGSLDKIYSRDVSEFMFGGFYYYHRQHFQLTAAVSEFYHSSKSHYAEAANSLRMEAKPTAIWYGKYHGYWTLLYQHWRHIPGDENYPDVPERFLLSISPGFGFPIGKESRGEIAYVFPVSGKNVVVFHGVEARLYYALPWTMKLF